MAGSTSVRPHQSLRAKVGVWAAVFMAAGAAGAGIVSHREVTRLIHHSALHEGRAVLDALAIPAGVAIASNEYVKLDNFVAELERAQHGHVLELMVLDAEGRLMATSETGVVGTSALGVPAGEDGFSAEFLARAVRGVDSTFRFGPGLDRPRYLDLSKPIIAGQRWGTLVARFSLAEAEARVNTLAAWTAIAAVGMALVAWMAAFFLISRLLLRPIQDLAEVAQRLGAGELQVRASLARSDELGELASSIDRMAHHLGEHTAELERAVRERTQELQVANRELAELATTDGLTGLRNHRYFKQTLEFELRRGARREHHLCLCMVDIDHFKAFNDRLGHPAGDEVLRRVGCLLSENLRATDVVARYGGEEFAIILLDTGAEEGFRTAQKIVELFRAAPFPGEEGQPGGKLTVSLGVAAYPEDAEDPTSLVRSADLALYEAKRRGRNTVVRWSLELPQHTGLTSDVVAASPVEEAGR